MDNRPLSNLRSFDRGIGKERYLTSGYPALQPLRSTDGGAELGRNTPRAGLLALCATCMVCVIYSGSRTAYIGVIALILGGGQSRGKGRFIFVAVIITVIASQIISEEYIGRFKSIGGEEAEGHSKDTRMINMQDAVTILMENPLGIGVAFFPAFCGARFGQTQDTHDLYFDVATNLGIQRLVVFIGLILAIMASLIASARLFRAQLMSMANLSRSKALSRSAAKQGVGRCGWSSVYV